MRSLEGGTPPLPRDHFATDLKLPLTIPRRHALDSNLRYDIIVVKTGIMNGNSMQSSPSPIGHPNSRSLLRVFRKRHARGRRVLLLLIENHLYEDETPLCTVFGVYKTRMYGIKLTNNGILIATNQQIVFFAHRPGGYDLKRFDYRSIASLELSQNLMGSSIHIRFINGEISVKWVQDDADEFVRSVEANRKIYRHDS